MQVGDVIFDLGALHEGEVALELHDYVDDVCITLNCVVLDCVRMECIVIFCSVTELNRIEKQVDEGALSQLIS